MSKYILVNQKNGDYWCFNSNQVKDFFKKLNPPTSNHHSPIKKSFRVQSQESYQSKNQQSRENKRKEMYSLPALQNKKDRLISPSPYDHRNQSPYTPKTKKKQTREWQQDHFGRDIKRKPISSPHTSPNKAVRQKRDVGRVIKNSMRQKQTSQRDQFAHLYVPELKIHKTNQTKSANAYQQGARIGKITKNVGKIKNSRVKFIWMMALIDIIDRLGG